MFEHVQAAPPDPILGLTEAFKADPSPDKINLGVGVYQDEHGRSPVLDSVRLAEARMLESQTTKGYLPITGTPEYAGVVRELVFGGTVEPARVVTAHAPGGTGALRVAGDFLRAQLGARTVWLTAPTWPNHGPVFAAAGLPVKTFPWFDAAGNRFDLEAAAAALEALPAGDVVLLHACCHNPTGCDPDPAGWERLAAVVAGRGLLPLVDFAYQGFADGLEADAAGVRAIVARCPEVIVCSSFSKNFGLYRERTGALSLVLADPDTAGRVASQLKTVIRTNYSNPPAHGGAIVSTISADPALRARWEEELTTMRERINGMRRRFAESMRAAGCPRDFSFLTSQRGMFSMLGLSKEQVETLRREDSIFMAGSSRINVAGLSEANLPKLCAAVNRVLAAGG